MELGLLGVSSLSARKVHRPALLPVVEIQIIQEFSLFDMLHTCPNSVLCKA